MIRILIYKFFAIKKRAIAFLLVYYEQYALDYTINLPSIHYGGDVILQLINKVEIISKVAELSSLLLSTYLCVSKYILKQLFYIRFTILYLFP